MSRKDRERFLRLKQQNQDYPGYRGPSSPLAQPSTPPPALESVVCSVCERKRHVPLDSLPADRSTFVCLSCQEEQAAPGSQGEP